MRPIIIITSNAEKELPDAFLRRCVFHFIEFPTRSNARDCMYIIRVSNKAIRRPPQRFLPRKNTGLRKKPSTSELLDWLGVLMAAGMEPDKIRDSDPFLVYFAGADLASIRRQTPRA